MLVSLAVYRTLYSTHWDVGLTSLSSSRQPPASACASSRLSNLSPASLPLDSPEKYNARFNSGSPAAGLSVGLAYRETPVRDGNISYYNIT